MNKMRQWSLLTAVAVVVVFAAGWMLAVKPQRSHAADLRSQAAGQQATNSTLQAQVAQLEQQKKGLPAQQRLLNKIASEIPDNPALPTLIRELASAANASGVDLVSIAPSTPTAVQPSVAAAPAAPAAGTTSSGSAGSATVARSVAPVPAAALNQIQLVLNVKGSYYNIESFFASLEKLQRAMRVTNWSLTPESTGSGSASSSSSATSGAPADPPGTIAAQMTALVYESPAIAPTTVSPAAPAAAAK
jgi:Tfp pilus assembly protein PilO